MNDWHVIHADSLMDAMRRTAAGEDPEHVYIELWANGDHEQVPPAPTQPSPTGTGYRPHPHRARRLWQWLTSPRAHSAQPAARGDYLAGGRA